MPLDKKIFMFNVMLVMGILLNSVYFSDIGIGGDDGSDSPVIDDGGGDDIIGPLPEPVCRPGDTAPCSTGIPGLCSRGERTCQGDFTWGTCQQTIFPVTEQCADGIDNDCDGKTDLSDEDCRCTEGEQRPCSNGPGICSDAYQLCVGGTWQPECIGPHINEFPELCYDNLDNDCDTLTDKSDFDCLEFCINNRDDDDDTLIDMQDDDCPRTCTSVYENGDNQIDMCCADIDRDGQTNDNECLVVSGEYLLLPPNDGLFNDGLINLIKIPIGYLCLENCFNDTDDDCDGLDDYSDPDCIEIILDVCNNQRDDDNDGKIDDCYCDEIYEDENPPWYSECLGTQGTPTKTPGELGEDSCYSEGEWYCDCPSDTYNVDNKCVICADFEICNDSLDNDCDGFTDCEDSECFSKTYCECKTATIRECGLDIGACTKGTQKCVLNKWTECKNAILPVKEICDDFKDNDCDGKTDEGCADEICNGIDDNSNGAVDEGCPCIYGATIDCGLDEGLCQFGYQICVGKTWSDCKEAIWPVKEKCGDLLDNDCDGFKDEDCFTTGTNPNALQLEIVMNSKIEVKSIQEIKILNKKTQTPIEGAYIFINTPSGLIETFTTGKEGTVFFRADELGIYKVEVTYQNIKLNSIFISQNLTSISFDTLNSIGLFFFGNTCTENSFFCLFMILLAFAASLLSYYVAGNYFTDTKRNLPQRLTSILTRLLIGVIFFFTPLFVVKVSGIFVGLFFSLIELGVLLGLEHYKNSWKRIKNLKTLLFPNKP
ncbi:MAG: MopE-related protein [Candidatus Diapherotrites archaeon]